MNFNEQIAQAGAQLRKLKRTCPQLFPQYGRLKEAERRLKEAREELKAAKSAWKSVGG